MEQSNETRKRGGSFAEDLVKLAKKAAPSEQLQFYEKLAHETLESMKTYICPIKGVVMKSPAFCFDSKEGIKDLAGKLHTRFDWSAVEGSTITLESVCNHPDKDKIISQIDKLADDAMVYAKQLDDHDTSHDLIDELLDGARKFNIERFERDYFTFRKFHDELLHELPDQSLERLITEHLGGDSAERVAKSLGDELLRRPSFELKSSLLENLPTKVLVEMSGLKVDENMNDHAMRVRSIQILCPEDNACLDAVIAICTDPWEKAEKLIKRGNLLDFQNLVTSHKELDFAELLTLDNCMTLACQTPLSKEIHRTLASAFYQKGKTKEAFTHLSESRDIAKFDLKENIMVGIITEMIKLTSDTSGSEASRAEVKTLEKKTKDLEAQLGAAHAEVTELHGKFKDLEAKVRTSATANGRIRALQDGLDGMRQTWLSSANRDEEKPARGSQSPP
jgi:hypothetical protein